MKTKYRIPWITMASVLGIIVQYVLARFGIELPSQALNALITLACGLLAVAGIVSPQKTDPPDNEPDETDETEAKEE